MITFLIMLSGVAIASFVLVTSAVYVCIKVGLLPGVSFDLGPKFKPSSTYIVYQVGGNLHSSVAIDVSKTLTGRSAHPVCKTYFPLPHQHLYGAINLSEQFLISRRGNVVNAQNGLVMTPTCGRSNDIVRLYENELAVAAA